MPVTFILTCEHAGNEIPKAYQKLFSKNPAVLYSHEAIDFGALRLAKHLASELRLPLFYTTTSRLLVEANRSLDNEELFSEYAKKLPDKEKQNVLDTYYFPHRNEVERQIGLKIPDGYSVVHFAIHSFTPALEQKVRSTEIGILFDEKSKAEKVFAKALKKALLKQNPALKVDFNSPYPGSTDGLATHLRKLFNEEVYAGFEIEVNQKFFLNGEPEVWENLMSEICLAFKEVIAEK